MVQNPNDRLAMKQKVAQENAMRNSLKSLEVIVPLLARSLGPKSEVILHDLARLPNSIVAISGQLTNRSIGGPINGFVLELIRKGITEDALNYPTNMPDGRTFRSSTMFIRNDDGEIIACLCINIDVTDLLKIHDALADFTMTTTVDSSKETTLNRDRSKLPNDGETYPLTIEEVMVEAVHRAIKSSGVPFDLMQKRHKMEVVRQLDERGLFIIRDAVDFVSNELGVTRYTIYNYLNELKLNGEISEESPLLETSIGNSKNEFESHQQKSL